MKPHFTGLQTKLVLLHLHMSLMSSSYKIINLIHECSQLCDLIIPQRLHFQYHYIRDQGSNIGIFVEDKHSIDNTKQSVFVCVYYRCTYICVYLSVLSQSLPSYYYHYHYSIDSYYCSRLLNQLIIYFPSGSLQPNPSSRQLQRNLPQHDSDHITCLLKNYK